MQKTKVDKKVVPADYSYFQYLEIRKQETRKHKKRQWVLQNLTKV